MALYDSIISYRSWPFSWASRHTNLGCHCVWLVVTFSTTFSARTQIRVQTNMVALWKTAVVFLLKYLTPSLKSGAPGPWESRSAHRMTTIILPFPTRNWLRHILIIFRNSCAGISPLSKFPDAAVRLNERPMRTSDLNRGPRVKNYRVAMILCLSLGVWSSILGAELCSWSTTNTPPMRQGSWSSKKKSTFWHLVGRLFTIR